MEDALFSVIERFIDGEDDADELKSIGRMYASWDQPIEIDLLDLPSEDPDREGAFGWSSRFFLGSFFNSLRVRTKADAMQTEDGPT